MSKAPIYPNEGPTMEHRLAQLKIAMCNLADMNPPKELMDQVWVAFREVEKATEAVIPIQRNRCRVGYGVSKESKAIACDNIISIVRVIKSSKAW